jgi:serine/threonine protein kinase
MVMDFEKGQPLSTILEESDTLPEPELQTILQALLDGIDRVHGASVWHRDIKPSNILIRHDGSPVLIDFGAARKDISGTDRSSMAVFTPAYAAPEQIYPVGDQGPWTDIYAMGATLYRAVTGKLPTNAAKRLQDEAHTPATQAARERYSASLLTAIDAALQLYPKDRPQSIDEWKPLLTPSDNEEDDQTVVHPLSAPIPNKAFEKKKRVFKPRVMVIASAAITAAVLLMVLLSFLSTDKKQNPQIAAGRKPAGEHGAPHVQAHLKITTIPAAAKVFLDGGLRGVTPLEATVGKGTHLLRLSLDDHHDWQSYLLVKADGEIPVRVPLLAK